MIPYFAWHTINLGPITLQVWGLFVALGVIAAVIVGRVFAKKYFLSADIYADLALFALVGAFIGARFFHVAFYDPATYAQDPAEILRIWHGGLSSTGGFVGAALAVWLFVRYKKLTFNETKAYADVATLSLWLGWGIGRLGCFLIHDHPGTLSHFALAVNYPALVPCALPNGQQCFMPRHDLGLYESMLGFVLFIFAALLFKKLAKRGWGYVSHLFCLAYAVCRFCLDFLRATDTPIHDARYLALTPAQWAMLALIAALTYSLGSGKLRPSSAKATDGKPIL